MFTATDAKALLKVLTPMINEAKFIIGIAAKLQLIIQKEEEELDGDTSDSPE